MIKYAITYECDRCGAHRDGPDYYYKPGQQLIPTGKPHDWWSVDGELICSKHTVKVAGKKEVAA